MLHYVVLPAGELPEASQLLLDLETLARPPLAFEMQVPSAAPLIKRFFAAIEDVAAAHTCVVKPMSAQYPAGRQSEVLGVSEVIEVVRAWAT